MPREETRLIRGLDEMTQPELAELSRRLLPSDGAPSIYDELDGYRKDAVELREKIRDGAPRYEFDYDDVVAALNYAEATRIYMNILTSMMIRGAEQLRDALRSARCSYCDWTYRDESFDFPADRELSSDDIAAVDARTKAAIAEHVKTCDVHPMRVLERQLDEHLRQAGEQRSTIEQLENRLENTRAAIGRAVQALEPLTRQTMPSVLVIRDQIDTLRRFLP